MGRVYAASFADVAVTAIQDLFQITAHSTGVVVLHEVHVSQRSDVGDAAEEILLLELTRDYTVTGSGGSTVTPTPVNPGDTAFGGTVLANSTVQAGTGTPVSLGRWTFNIRAGFDKVWTPETRPIVRPSGIIVLELPVAPADSLTMSGTLVFEALG